MALTAGTRLGPYEIGAKLGAGGMGEVYRARDTRLDRAVALKLLPDEFAGDPSRRARFELEARAVAALNHPNILTLYDVGSTNGLSYIVSELVDGGSLRGADFTGRKVTEIAVQIARGLACAHAAGIIHRDLKPENILITRDGRAKILDFGLAKVMPARAGAAANETATIRTDPGVVMGTAGYMSPEQVRGEDLDQRSDIFSFGVILYEMLAKRPAFRGPSTVETMTAILKEQPPDLPETVPLPVRQIVSRCLEKNVENRFQSASDLAFALQALAGFPGTSTTVAPVGRKRRRLGWWSIGGLVTILAITGWWRAATPTPMPVYHQLTYQVGYVGSARFTPDGSTVVYSHGGNAASGELYSLRSGGRQARPLGVDADVAGMAGNGEMAVILKHRFHGSWLAVGTLARLSVDGGTPRPILEEVSDADITRDGAEFAAVRTVGGRARLEFPIGKVLFETTGWISSPRIAPDGRRVAFLEHPDLNDDRGAVSTVDLAGNYRKLTEYFAGTRGLAWTTDGKEIWYTAANFGKELGIRAVTPSGKSRPVLDAPAELQLQDISASGKVLLTSIRFQVELGLQRADKPGSTDLTYTSDDNLGALSSDGAWLIFNMDGAHDYSVMARDPNGSSPLNLGEGYGAGVTPDNRFVAASRLADRHKVILYPIGAGEKRQIDLTPLTVELANEDGITFSRDGRLALLTASDQNHKLRDYLVELGSGRWKPVTPEGSREGKLSPDGTRVATLDLATQTPAVLDLRSGESVRIPGGSVGKVLGWSSDGRSVFVWNEELPARVFRVDVSSGERQLLVSVNAAQSTGSMYGRLVVTPDGMTAAYRIRRGFYTLYTVAGVH